MPVSPGASGMQRRGPCRPWRGTLASGHKPRCGLLALQSLESNPQLSFATRMEDWTCLGQHKRQPEFPVVTRASRRNSRKTTWLPRHRKMKPFPAPAPQEKSHVRNWRSKGHLAPLMRPTKFPEIPVSLERNPEVFPAPSPLRPFSPPDLDGRVDSPALSGRGSRPSGRTSGLGRSHEDIPDVASWVVPHSEGPRFPGRLSARASECVPFGPAEPITGMLPGCCSLAVRSCPLCRRTNSPRVQSRHSDRIAQTSQLLPNHRIQLRPLGHLLRQLRRQPLHLLAEGLVVLVGFLGADVAP